ncbi:NapC/NirT family cytochrome c [Campylobacter hyointestinalis]|uniref:NapC/NirT family cytochrome c n=1 Tax=Campylobacter hyointestinalis TaxID=198 RepID=UPI00072C45BA|nr:NapC/NirT family cytochrome c [Campylobacter hyointestinalis]CUU88367.1 putative tetraheme cytochrome c [Campylobacter hyointestinalis subsp. hyointestinalis]
MNGISEATHMVFNDAKDMDWQGNRKNREKFVYDSCCISCHQTILDINSSNQNINDMHKLYAVSIQNKDKKLSCVSCHKTVGHKNLGKILYEIKHPPVGDWGDEIKK